jgi:cystathionine beta-lyase/cystathionine gamma-synthase
MLRNEDGGAAPRRAGFSTRAVHAGAPAHRPGAPVAPAIQQTSTFYSESEGAGEVLYTRYGNNPTQQLLERRVAALEGAAESIALGSGMAALACAILSVAQAGDHVIAGAALYGGTHALLDRELSRLGITTTYVDFGVPAWTDALRPETRAVLVETPTNPLLRVADVQAIVDQSRAHGSDAAVIVDSTFASPYNFRPLEHGADLAMHSATKYLAGHSDVTAGVVSGSRERVAAIRERARTLGPMLDPHAAWLVERGVRTLAVRMERHNQNGLAVARWCERQPGIARVHYPGLASHPDHPRASRLLNGFGGMLGIELAGGGAAASRFVGMLRLASVAPSLGGVETLVSEPRYTSHAAFSPEERARRGIADGFVRFSLGIEDADDIIADIAQALK